MNNKTFIIGITGGSGSGKTTFIKNLRNAFSEDEVCIISQDDYYFPMEMHQFDDKGYQNFDLPRAIDKKNFRTDLIKLMNGEAVEKTEYTFNNTEAIPKKFILKPAKVIIIEGLFVFHFKKIRKLLDLKIYIHAKENLKVIRRIRRDQVERNYPIEDVLYRYENHVLPSFEKYIEPYMEQADIVINNNDSLEKGLNLVKGFIQNMVQNNV